MSDTHNLPATIAGLDASALALLGDLANNNMDALSGLSLGGFPTIRLNGTRFVVVEGDNKINLPVLEMQAIFIKAAPGLRKAWYATKYDPNSADDNRSPDCFSNDGITPHPSAPSRQSETCAACPHNVFGSGTGADGRPSKGKACSDFKQTAIYTPDARNAGAENDVFGFRLPPASLKNFAAYVKALTNRGIPLAGVVTKVGFDPEASFPVLTFKYSATLNAQQIKAIVEKAKSDEVEAILNPITPNAKTPVPVATPPAQPSAPAATPTAQPSASSSKKRGRPAKPADNVFDMGLGAAPEPEEDEDIADEGDSVSDDDLRAALGL